LIFLEFAVVRAFAWFDVKGWCAMGQEARVDYIEIAGVLYDDYYF